MVFAFLNLCTLDFFFCICLSNEKAFLSDLLMLWLERSRRNRLGVDPISVGRVINLTSMQLLVGNVFSNMMLHIATGERNNLRQSRGS